MTIRTIAAGTVGLVMATVLSMSALFQSAGLSATLTVATDRALGLALNLRAAWSLAQLAITILLVLPVAIASIAVMLGTPRAFRALRIAAFAGAACSLATVLIHVAMSLQQADSSVRPFGPRTDLEVLTALCALALQILLGAMLSGLHPSQASRGGVLTPAPH